MFAKLLVIVIALGATACILLVNRQQRLDIAHEMSLAHRQSLKNDRAIVEMRRQIARSCTPSEIRLAKADLKVEWEAIPARPIGGWPAVQMTKAEMLGGAANGSGINAGDRR